MFIHISFDDFAADTVITWRYFKRWIKRHYKKIEDKFSSASHLVEHFDEVPKNIIGKFNVNEAYNRAPAFAKRIIRFALPDEHEENRKEKNNLGISFRPDKIREEIEKRKKVPTGVINELIARAVQQALVSKSNDDVNLYVEDEGVTKEWKSYCCKHGIAETELKGDVSIFVVDKSSSHADGIPFQRIITDGRKANAMLENLAKMELFTLEALSQRMANLMTSDNRSQIFALSCDLRHWFHQIKLPRRFRQFLRIKLNNKYVYPACFPMGFHMSPAIAQACTWAILLADLDTDNQITKNKRKSLGIDENWKFEEYVQWLPLTDGGAIFVLIDNIFIITKNKTVRDNWESRIWNMCGEFGATLKEAKQNSSSTSTSTSNNQSPSFKYFERADFIKKEDPTSIVFSGIEFTKVGRRTAEPIDEIESLNNNNNNIWEGTYRELASILGQCMWTYRVRGTKMLDLEKLLDLYSEKAFPRGNQSWDDKVDIINNNHFNTLQFHYKDCRENRNFIPYEKVHKQESWALIATDAALKSNEKEVEQDQAVGEEEKNFIGGYILHPNNNKKLKINTNQNIIEPPETDVSLAFKQEHEEEGIALAELLAAVVGVEKTFELFPDDPPDVFMLAIDSMAAKGMISRGFSRLPRARELLRRLFRLLDGRKLFVMYVESENNPADAPSRDKPWKEIFGEKYLEQWEKTKQRLIQNIPFARTTALFSGKQVVQGAKEKTRRQREAENNDH